MLIALCLVLQNSTKIPLPPMMMITILILDYIMLLFGYLGEINIMDRFSAMIIGFIPFFIIFYLIFNKFMLKSYNPLNYLIFGIYFVIWAGYGISYMFEEKIKNILTNIFDCTSKAVVAIILSVNYAML
jgi:hypothetical protein